MKNTNFHFLFSNITMTRMGIHFMSRHHNIQTKKSENVFIHFVCILSRHFYNKKSNNRKQMKIFVTVYIIR